jgi:polysaccharide export outer membrane protein
MRSILFLFFLSFFMTSCISRKELIYLQDKGNNQQNTVTEIIQKPYRLQIGDVISISIRGLESELLQLFVNPNQDNSEQGLYFTGYVVDDHGNIRMPVIGELNVLGFTLDDVRMKVEEVLLNDHFKKTTLLFVNVKTSGFRYTITGEVGSTGTKTVFQDRLNIMEAIANSGDIAITGDRKHVQVIRKFPQGTETYSIDLTDSNAVNSPVYFLQYNDFIYVKPLKQKTWGTGKTGIESLGTIITLLSLATTTFLLLTR